MGRRTPPRRLGNPWAARKQNQRWDTRQGNGEPPLEGHIGRVVCPDPDPASDRIPQDHEGAVLANQEAASAWRCYSATNEVSRGTRRQTSHK